MKYTLKQKISVYLSAFVFVIGLSAVSLPGTASALTAADCAPGTKLSSSKDICCPTGQTGVHVHGQGVNRSCCPTDAVNRAKADSDKNNDAQRDGLTAKYCLFSKYLNPVINLLSAVVGVAVVIGVIYGAIQVSSSAGDPQKSAKGKEHIRNALLGLMAYILLYAFLQFVIPGGKLN
jgi:hypothetical protein